LPAVVAGGASWTVAGVAEASGRRRPLRRPWLVLVLVLVLVAVCSNGRVTGRRRDAEVWGEW